MALELNINISRSLDQLSLLIIDNTGAYNVNSNPTGYGTPNPSVADFVTFDVAVTVCDSITLLPTGQTYMIDVYNNLPNTTGSGYQLLNTDIGLGADEKIPDGVYKFVITADTDNGSTYTDTVYEVYYEIVGCCIDTLTIQSFDCGCGGDSKKIKDLVKANMWLGLLRPTVNELGQVVESAIERCGQYEKAAEIIRELQKICNNKNCKGCNGC